MDSGRSTSSVHSSSPFTVSSAPSRTSMMRCPKCGGEQKKSDICAECGIVVEKYLKIKQSDAYQPAVRASVSYMNDIDEESSAFPLKAVVAAASIGLLAVLAFFLI